MLVLTPEELRDLTGKVHAKAQMRELSYMGVPFRLATEGRVKVLRSDLSGEAVEGPRLEKIRTQTRRVLPTGARKASGSLRRQEVVSPRENRG